MFINLRWWWWYFFKGYFTTRSNYLEHISRIIIMNNNRTVIEQWLDRNQTILKMKWETIKSNDAELNQMWNDVSEYSIIKWAECKQCTYNTQQHSRPTNEATGGTLGGIYMKAKKDHLNQVYSDHMVPEIVRREAELHEWWPGLSPLRLDGSRDGQKGRLDHHEGVAKDTQN